MAIRRAIPIVFVVSTLVGGANGNAAENHNTTRSHKCIRLTGGEIWCPKAPALPDATATAPAIVLGPAASSGYGPEYRFARAVVIGKPWKRTLTVIERLASPDTSWQNWLASVQSCGASDSFTLTIGSPEARLYFSGVYPHSIREYITRDASGQEQLVEQMTLSTARVEIVDAQSTPEANATVLGTDLRGASGPLLISFDAPYNLSGSLTRVSEPIPSIMFSDVSEVGDDLESPWHNMGHGTEAGRLVNGSRPNADMTRGARSPSHEVFYVWHTKVDDLKWANIVIEKNATEKSVVLNYMDSEGQAARAYSINECWPIRFNEINVDSRSGSSSSKEVIELMVGYATYKK